jgi:cytoskeletal protein CcmA (bactofilin family)
LHAKEFDLASDNGLNSEMTVIGCGTTIRGEVDFDQGARILGVFEGKIRSKGEVHIAETADCSAEIDAENITIDGKTTGNVIARNRLRLSEHARLTGDICAKTLLVEEGASFTGHCSVGDSAAAGRTGSNTTTQPGTSKTAEVSTRVDFKPPWRNGNTDDANSDDDAKRALTEANRAAASSGAA